MSAQDVTSEHQFGEMHRKLNEEGGFTYNPRSKRFVSEGFAVATKPEAAFEVPVSRGGADETHLSAYTQGSAPTWSPEDSPTHIGGWDRPYDPKAHVLDLPDVYPATPEGEVQARGATLEHNQEAYNALHRDFTDVGNPFHDVNRDPFTPGSGASSYFAGDPRLWTKQPVTHPDQFKRT
jgi:hypothetical protein